MTLGLFLAAAAAASAGAADRGPEILARTIAARNLYLNTSPSPQGRYLLAGANQFRSLWARDFSFATAGALIAGQTQAVHDSLDALFAAQRSDGLLPRGLDNEDITWRVIFGLLGMPPAFHPPLKAWWTTEYGVIVLDSNVTVPWAASRYLLKTHDLEAARRWFAPAERALAFFQEQGYLVDGLIGNQPPYSDWADSVQRTGRVSFTNVIYVLALRGMSEWATLLGDPERALFYASKALSAQQAFVHHFWSPTLEAVSNFDGDEHLTADANLLAVAHGVLPPELARRTMRTLRASPLWRPMPGRTTTPDYPSSMKGFNVKLIGIASYHDSMYWLWLTAAAAMAERALGNCDSYDEIMSSLSRLIAKGRAIREVYELKRDGVTLKPVSRLLYHAENPFTWSSAMYLEASEGGCVR
jgi:glycogen debranching enzyme